MEFFSPSSPFQGFGDVIFWLNISIPSLALSSNCPKAPFPPLLPLRNLQEDGLEEIPAQVEEAEIESGNLFVIEDGLGTHRRELKKIAHENYANVTKETLWTAHLPDLAAGGFAAATLSLTMLTSSTIRTCVLRNLALKDSRWCLRNFLDEAKPFFYTRS
jgi:hypothetical protein